MTVCWLFTRMDQQYKWFATVKYTTNSSSIIFPLNWRQSITIITLKILHSKNYYNQLKRFLYIRIYIYIVKQFLHLTFTFKTITTEMRWHISSWHLKQLLHLNESLQRWDGTQCFIKCHKRIMVVFPGTIPSCFWVIHIHTSRSKTPWTVTRNVNPTSTTMMKCTAASWKTHSRYIFVYLGHIYIYIYIYNVQ